MFTQIVFVTQIGSLVYRKTFYIACCIASLAAVMLILCMVCDKVISENDGLGCYEKASAERDFIAHMLFRDA